MNTKTRLIFNILVATIIGLYVYGGIIQPPITMEETITVQAETPKTVDQLIDYYSEKYEVSKQEMTRTIKCESLNLDETGQSQLRYTRDHPKWGVKKGDQERSFGIVQIHLPSHPEVTLEQALNNEFAVEFMAKAFSKGKQEMWTCY